MSDTLPNSALPSSSSYYLYRKMILAPLASMLPGPPGYIQNPCMAYETPTWSPAGLSCCPSTEPGVNQPCWKVPPTYPVPKGNGTNDVPRRPVHKVQKHIVKPHGTLIPTNGTASTPWTEYLLIGGLGYGAWYLWKKHSKKGGAKK